MQSYNVQVLVADLQTCFRSSQVLLTDLIHSIENNWASVSAAFPPIDCDGYQYHYCAISAFFPLI